MTSVSHDLARLFGSVQQMKHFAKLTTLSHHGNRFYYRHPDTFECVCSAFSAQHALTRSFRLPTVRVEFFHESRRTERVLSVTLCGLRACTSLKCYLLYDAEYARTQIDLP
jgi:hypothetical protein